MQSLWLLDMFGDLLYKERWFCVLGVYESFLYVVFLDSVPKLFVINLFYGSHS